MQTNVDTSDRMFVHNEWEKLHHQFQFTMCAASNPPGGNPNNHLSNFCYEGGRDFLQTDCSGHSVWMNFPFNKIKPMLSHFLSCWNRDPAHTSGCVVVPKWDDPELAAMLTDFQLVKEYDEGQTLFSAPVPGSDKRRILPGIPWPVQVWHKAPSDIIPAATPQVVGEGCASLGSLAQDVTRVMKFKAKVSGADAVVVIDSGAEGDFVDPTYVAKVGLTTYRHIPGRKVVVGGKNLEDASTTVKPCIRLGTCKFNRELMVTTLPDGDIILGMPWLMAVNPTVDWRQRTLTINRNGNLETWEALRGDAQEDVLGTTMREDNKTGTGSTGPDATTGDRTFELCTPEEFASSMRHAKVMFLVVLDPIPASAPKEELSETEYQQPAKKSRHARFMEMRMASLDAKVQAALERIKREYKDDVLRSDLPCGVPLDKGVAHYIPLVEGAVPQHRSPYRLSPRELEELNKQLEELLAKGYIEPSSSPWGAPILFVPKPRQPDKLRMCIDYRALNKLTVANNYPLPRVDQILDQLSGAKVWSKLDLKWGYWQVPVAEEDRDKTAFNTRYGQFRWRVMPFGLRSAPSTFMTLMNKVLRPFLDKFVVVYLDDILVYSKSIDDHERHLRLVLDKLREHNLVASLDKCEWFTSECFFLGHIITPDGIKADPAKVKTVLEWPTPVNAGQLRSFLGLTNYFRGYIKDYAAICGPLYKLLKKDAPWLWDSAEAQAFEQLKQALTTPPVLVTPDHSKPFKLKVYCDASKFAIGAVLMQVKDGEERPVAYESRKLSSAEMNYNTYEQELLALVHALRVWRCHLDGPHKFTAVMDNRPLTWLFSLRDKHQLTRRQAGWLEHIMDLQFDVEWVPGKNNPADAPSRRPDYDCSDSSAAVQPNGTATHALMLCHLRVLMAQVFAELHLSPEADVRLLSKVVAGYSVDPMFKDARRMDACSIQQQGAYYTRGDKLVVPDAEGLREELIGQAHDAPYSGHKGQRNTLAKLERYYWWPGMTIDVTNYVRTCLSCQRNKVGNQHNKAKGLLQPLPIPTRSWESISLDFIVGLPKTQAGYDSIVVFVDRLTKLAHFVPVTTDITAYQLADVYLKEIFRLHGSTRSMISDRDPKFVSAFWSNVFNALGTKRCLSTAYHPQSDGQTERVNREIEDALRHYINPRRNNWDRWLCLLEFAYNDTVNASTGYTPFYLNYGQHPLTPLALTSPVRTADKLATNIVADLRVHLQRAKTAIQAAQQRQAKYYNRGKSAPSWKAGEYVWLSTSFINLKLQEEGKKKKKLLPRYCGPFKIVKCVGENAFELDLPAAMKCHNVFHSSKLRTYHKGLRESAPPPLIVNGEEEFFVEEILAHRDIPVGTNKVRTEFLIKWLGYGHEHNTWEPEETAEELEALDRYWESRTALAPRGTARHAQEAGAKKTRGRPRTAGLLIRFYLPADFVQFA